MKNVTMMVGIVVDMIARVLTVNAIIRVIYSGVFTSDESEPSSS